MADRLLEVTGTIEKRKMRDQVLDRMDLERERGITIKMTPVRMVYRPLTNNKRQITNNENSSYKSSVMGGQLSDSEYILNLIDTPGHIDFSYEVSRALKAVEGSLLLVDATQGVQAQTLTTLGMARELGLAILPVVSKIDSPLADVEGTRQELAKLLNVSESDVLLVSGRTGEGVEALLDAVVERIPPPREEIRDSGSFRGLIFDFEYSNHQGIILYTRVLEGKVRKGDELSLVGARERSLALETGIFTPEKAARDGLQAGEIGYIVTGIKKPGVASVGDTVTLTKKLLPALPGYALPSPVVFASIYPESQDDFTKLRQALERLKLSDSSLSYEEESSGVLGRGFRAGFLGMLHLEIVTERLKREFGLVLVITTPSINYEVELANGKRIMVYSPSLFPDHGSYKEAREPWVKLKIITPPEFLSDIMVILYDHEAEIGDTETMGGKRVALSAVMPLRELMRNFFDEIKSRSSGFASLSYEFLEMRPADVARLDILVADEAVPAFARVVSKRRVEAEARAAVEKLAKILPRQLFVVKVQGRALGRIISSETVKALRKDVTGYLYGGDITRKMKLREKQKKGKKKMQARGRVNIPHEVFLKMVRE
ncbi:MAG: translation elongation factor 4 [bacterium]|nr:translation elongation factor 4 [bacterium]